MAATTPRDEDINNEILIQEIEMRPALYNKSLKEYSDINIKGRLWEEVCVKVFINSWGNLSPEQKTEAGMYSLLLSYIIY